MLRCSCPFNNLKIYPNYDVGICDRHIIGNLKRDPNLLSVWNNKYIRSIRSKFYNGNIPDDCIGCGKLSNNAKLKIHNTTTLDLTLESLDIVTNIDIGLYRLIYNNIRKIKTIKINGIYLIYNNSVYRYGAIFFYRPLPYKHYIEGEIIKHYPRSILYDYILRSGLCKYKYFSISEDMACKLRKDNCDINSFKHVVKIHCLKYKTPKLDELVVYIRLGDLFLCDKNRSLKTAINHYNEILQYYNQEIKKFNNATLVCTMNFHHLQGNMPSAITDSLNLVNAIKSYINKLGINVSIQSSISPDKDFCYMCNSHYYIPGQSCICRLVKYCLPGKAKVYDKPQA